MGALRAFPHVMLAHADGLHCSGYTIVTSIDPLLSRIDIHSSRPGLIVGLSQLRMLAVIVPSQKGKEP